MKKYVLFFVVLFVMALGAVPALAQCDPNTASPIKCSYYNEGYQDGATDAKNNRNNDYRRYRDKFERRYESFFRDGYNAGYNSVSPTTRWTNSQRSAYDSGYTIGQNDRRRSNQNRSAENAGGQYDQNIGLYFQQGYSDGFNNRARQYDVEINTNPTYPTYPTYPTNPGGGSATGFASWQGRVDNRANIVLTGGTISAQNINGNGVQTNYQNVNGVLPRRASTVNARMTDGRGSVSVIQQPNRSNNFTAIVQIHDPKGGSGNYKLEISWAAAANVEEPYQSGNVLWRGRVDQTANIVIYGSDVQSQDASGSGLSSVNFNINGYLARRPGSVNVRKRNGRGTVTVLQQPSVDNDFTAIVQVFDPNGGADNYEVEITW
jgi:hypothetical protein